MNYTQTIIKVSQNNAENLISCNLNNQAVKQSFKLQHIPAISVRLRMYSTNVYCDVVPDKFR